MNLPFIPQEEFDLRVEKVQAAMAEQGYSYREADGSGGDETFNENGDIIKYENGAYIYQDTNNSTDDFERGLQPIIRRHNAGIPAWNHSVNN